MCPPAVTGLLKRILALRWLVNICYLRSENTFLRFFKLKHSNSLAAVLVL